jgi:hypothetical protein
VPDELEQELADLIASQQLATRLVDVLHQEIFGPARELFGDRSSRWVVSVLRATAATIERLDPP